jgi:dihydroorotate dehydrogenase electron transfer subunit
MMPGQFLMVRSKRTSDALLGRAFALYDVIRNEDGTPESVDIVFHIVGKMTQFLAVEPLGTPLVVWGPLGNGFDIAPRESRTHLVMVAGGIGQTPFLTLAKECLGREQYGGRKTSSMSQVSLCYGARSQEYLAGLQDFRDAGVNVHVATDDGSEGHHGLVTELLDSVVKSSDQQTLRVVCCGPEPMMQAVSEVAQKYDLPCEVSLETPMACGLGICFSCVTQVKQPDGSWDFKRTCVDGPVFDAQQIVW